MFMFCGHVTQFIQPASPTVGPVALVSANTVLRRRHAYTKTECEAFKNSKFRWSFVGSFAGKPVIYSVSIYASEGHCPPLVSRPGMLTALGG